MIKFSYNVSIKRVLVFFDYDEEILRVVKTITGRAYHPKGKIWSIPITSLDEARLKLAKWQTQDSPELGFEVSKHKNLMVQAKLAKDNKSPFTVDLPLFDFQKIGSSFIWVLPSAALFDEPGTGKTIQTIGAIREDKALNRVLILCPASVKWNWENELKRFDPEGIPVVIGGNKRKREELWNSKARYYIANYELLIHDIDILQRNKWDCIVADEAHRIVNTRNKSVKNLHKLTCGKKVALTGTPIVNELSNLYGIYTWLIPGLLGTLEQFDERYCVRDYWGKVIRYINVDDFKSKIEPYSLRRTKAEVLKDLPDKLVSDVRFELSDEERKLYEGIRKEILSGINKADINKIGNPLQLQITLTKVLRLQQLSDGMELIGDNKKSSKLETLRELLEDTGDKVIIYSKFSTMCDILERELAVYNPLKITGSVDNRQELVDKFNQTVDNRVMIISDAGGIGINLQHKCSTIIFYDLPFSISKLEQATGRIDRIGQTNKMLIYNLIAKNTVDEHIKRILERKEKLAIEMLDWSDIKEMLALESSSEDNQ